MSIFEKEQVSVYRNMEKKNTKCSTSGRINDKKDTQCTLFIKTT